MALNKLWKFSPPCESHLVKEFEENFQLPPLVSAILIQRGYASIEKVQAFLQPQLSELHDPYLMKDMRAAVHLLKEAIFSKKRIVILGDYDVDGITATALMVLFLKQCGCKNLDYFIPNRFVHGYGLTQASAEVLLTMKPNLVLTVDNGITAHQEVEFLHQHGIETLITDHHLADAHQLPRGVVVNPNRPDCTYPFKGISGCGVALKLLMALRKELRDLGHWSPQNPEPNLKPLLDLVALGTVADVVPLVDENRLLVFHGLQVMNAEARFGIRALALLKNVKAINAQTLSFQFSPLLNAAGRMQNASMGVELLLSSTLQQAQKMAQALNAANNERRVTEAHMLEIAMQQAQALQHRHGLVVHSPEFHEGIIGIVATRLVERYHKPALVCAKNGGSYKCSARSIPELHIKNVFDECADLLEKFGGHAGAGGCTVNEQHFGNFKEKFEFFCQKHLTPRPQPTVALAGTLSLKDIDWNLLQQLERLQPYGAANPMPLFAIATPQHPFQALKEKHVKWQTEGKEIIGWNLLPAFHPKSPQQLAVQLGINEFQGKRKIQLLIQDYQ